MPCNTAKKNWLFTEWLPWVDADECCTELSKSNLLIAEGELVITWFQAGVYFFWDSILNSNKIVFITHQDTK